MGQGKVRLVRAKIEAIHKYPVPKTMKELGSFLGLVRYYRVFCPNFSTVVAPLTNLLRKKSAFVWSPHYQESFLSVKHLICCLLFWQLQILKSLLKYRWIWVELVLELFCCKRGRGVIDHPVCFFSRKFKHHQLNYSVVEKETLAPIWNHRFFEVYVSSGSKLITFCLRCRIATKR